MSKTQKRMPESGSKRQQKRQARVNRRRKEQQRKQIINITMMILGVVALLVMLNWEKLQPYEPVEGLLPAAKREHPNAVKNTMGDPDAPVVIEEFSDFLCSHCRNFYADNEMRIVDQYIATGKVYFIYRTFGYHPPPAPQDSGRAAEAAYCAGDQGLFWDMHDTIFSNFEFGSTRGFSANTLTTMAESLGMDVPTFESCLDDGKYNDQVDQDRSDATSMGVSGTPSFFVNGVMVEGNDIDTLVLEIENALAAAGTE